MSETSNILTREINADDVTRIKKSLSAYQKENDNQYVDFFAKIDDVSVLLYKPNKKGKIKVVFQGDRAEKIYGKFFALEQKETIYISNKYPQIGSDEVGTGDFFGPVCVCASYIRKEDLPLLKELGITDSKKMNDEYILSIGPKLINRFEYSQLSLPNDKYNAIKDDFNMNAIKAKMHNRCILNLLDKHHEANVFQDQFVEKENYYKYLENEERVARNISFHTKGESLFPSVALASVIARYSFLRKMEALNKKYNVSFPLGAGKPVDEFIPHFIDKFGENELKNVAKLNWANYRKFKGKK